MTDTLTSRDRTILREYLDLFLRLDYGITPPDNNELSHFVDAIKGKVPPETPEEMAYIKFKNIRSFDPIILFEDLAQDIRSKIGKFEEIKKLKSEIDEKQNLINEIKDFSSKYGDLIELKSEIKKEISEISEEVYESEEARDFKLSNLQENFNDVEREIIQEFDYYQAENAKFHALYDELNSLQSDLMYLLDEIGEDDTC